MLAEHGKGILQPIPSMDLWPAKIVARRCVGLQGIGRDAALIPGTQRINGKLGRRDAPRNRLGKQQEPDPAPDHHKASWANPRRSTQVDKKDKQHNGTVVDHSASIWGTGQQKTAPWLASATKLEAEAPMAGLLLKLRRIGTV